MKKLTLFFFALLAVCLAFQACDNSKTYAEMLEEEKDAIKAFIKDSYQPLFFKAHQNQIIRFNCICRIRRTFIHNLHIHPACQLHILIPAYIRCRILRIELYS